MKDDFIVDEISGRRWDVALEVLSEGGNFVFQNCRFALDKKRKELSCCINFEMRNPYNISQEEVMNAFKNAKELFNGMRSKSKAFDDLAKSYELKFSIVRDYGTGLVQLFSLEGDKIKDLRA